MQYNGVLEKHLSSSGSHLMMPHHQQATCGPEHGFPPYFSNHPAPGTPFLTLHVELIPTHL